MLGHYTCYACGDSWCRDLIDLEVQAYIEAHPELEERILSRDINIVDLGEVLCDGCEDFFNDESEAQAQDDLNGTHQSWLCGNCGEVAYDCGCDGDAPSEDIEDEIDRKAELMEHGRLE